LDEELGLLPGHYTPQMQETMTRLGSKMPFEQAVEEVWLNQRTRVEEGTLRGMTYRHGEAAEAIERAEAERVEREAPRATTKPGCLLISSDGAFIHLTNGEWREVKTMVIGEFETLWQAKQGELVVKTSHLSYFSRSYRIREFERYALDELHRRGVDNARLIVTVNDGSEWIESFSQYHFPQAVSILDFNHPLDYMAQASQAVFGEGTTSFQQWFTRLAHQLKHKPPQQTLADLRLLQAKNLSDEQAAVVDQALSYLRKRQERIDYAHFLAKGWPIGSGSAESSHQVVVHSRLKQAGMRWAEAHVNPLLALRNLICNGRGVEGWSQIPAYYWQQQRRLFQEQTKQPQPVTPPITFASVAVAPATPAPLPTTDNLPYRPAPDHPWRCGIWPTQEAWRWN
jgi:hypothetical protein